ncbi:unnamed protein product, partial [Arabidopsis halleri]
RLLNKDDRGIFNQNTETAFFVETYVEPSIKKYEQPLYAHLNAITLRSGTAYKEPVDPRYQEEEQPLPHPRPGRRPADRCQTYPPDRSQAS